MGAQAEAAGPDFTSGIPLEDLADGRTLSGRVGDCPVLLSRFGSEFVAVSGACTHYGAALASGLVERETVRCPLHHACFDLRTGAPLHAPALDPLDRWQVEVHGGTVFVRDKLEASVERREAAPTGIERVLIIGGGAAGVACANELRRLGYAGAVTMLSADRDPPVDRPNLSKDYLAGTMPSEWLPLRSSQWYADNGVDLRLGVEATRIDAVRRHVHTASGEELPYDRLLIATGSEPNRLRAPGFDRSNVFTLRSLADAAAIAAQAKAGARAVVVGSSFIGLEAAAALRQRDVAVAIVAPEHVPFERAFGTEVGTWLKQLHERNDVRFHLGTVGQSFDGTRMKLANGISIDADFVLVGIGVRPRVRLAESLAMPTDGGVPVDAYLETSEPCIFAAGDIAAFPDLVTGEPTRIEHWVTAERQGQVAAANMLGRRLRFEAVPFFWTEQYGTALRYVGHAPAWDEVRIDGDIDSGDFIARYFTEGEHRASAAVGRDVAILEDEKRFEQEVASRREPAVSAGIQSSATSVEASHGS
jgi:NADPH-dependent 2,4-dienoyl-CoA reductase/sulfur reductase-like enzyme/nitrite reductase/ring-hydroxylating ferredoxin subunit